MTSLSWPPSLSPCAIAAVRIRAAQRPAISDRNGTSRRRDSYGGSHGNSSEEDFALTNRLWPAVAAGGGARVVELTSTGHRYSPIRWDDMWFERGYDKWIAYGQAKTANSLFAVRLDALGADAGVRAFAVHPGGIRTPLQRFLSQEEMVALGWIDEHGNPREGIVFKTPEQGAATTLWAATSPRLDGMGGVYCEDCDIADLVPDDAGTAVRYGVRSYAVDPAEAERLWDASAELTGVDAFAASRSGPA